MAQPPLHLIIGNYNTSSWSLRAWLTLRLARLAFSETRIPLRRPETPERIGQHSPSGKLPVLLAEGVPIWDSLAIAEFIAELEPWIWPLDPIARAEARAISAEVHSGFTDLRRLMPMDIVDRFAAPGRLPRGLTADIRRVMTIWEHCRARFAAHGPFLFGAFSITDAMMAPIATRFVTHGVPLAGVVEDYVDSVMAWPDMVTWCDAAAAEVAEREATGSLAVASVTRPGRILGPEPVAARPTALAEEASTAEATAPAASHEATSSAAPPDDAPNPAPATLDGSGLDDTGQVTGEATPEVEPATADPRSATVSRPIGGDGGRSDDALHPPKPVEARPDPAAVDSAPAPRRRLFESAPIALNDEAALPEPAHAPPASAAEPETRATASVPGDHAPIDRDQPPSRKLGWLRHAVPADHFVDSDRPYRRASAEPPAAAGERSPASERAAVEATRAPLAPPQPPDQTRSASQATRSGGQAIKPIGGGILRRR
jgi:glutathione S-transferase